MDALLQSQVQQIYPGVFMLSGCCACYFFNLSGLSLMECFLPINSLEGGYFEVMGLKGGIMIG